MLPSTKRRVVFVDVDTKGARDAFARYSRECTRLLPATLPAFEFSFEPISLQGTNIDELLNHRVRSVIDSNPILAIATSARVAKSFLRESPSFPVLFHTSQTLSTATADRSSLIGQPNMTGLMSSVLLGGKRLELLKDLLPSLKSVGILQDNFYAQDNDPAIDVDIAAKDLSVGIVAVKAQEIGALELELAKKKHLVQAWLVPRLAPGTYSAAKVCELINRTNRPSVYALSRMAREGGLMSYEANIEDAMEIFARQTVAILSGTPISKIPIEHLKRFRLAINLKTAALLKLEIPSNLIRRANLIIS